MRLSSTEFFMEGPLMGYLDERQKARDLSATGGREDHSWEEEKIPLLHSGFLETTTHGDPKSVLSVQFFYSHGRYRVRIIDRQNNEQAFLDVYTIVGCFEKIEIALGGDALDWVPMKSGRNGYGGP